MGEHTICYVTVGNERNNVRKLNKHAPFGIQIIVLTIEHVIRKFKTNEKTHIIYGSNHQELNTRRKRTIVGDYSSCTINEYQQILNQMF